MKRTMMTGKKGLLFLVVILMAMSQAVWAGTWKQLTTVDPPTLSGHTAVFDPSSGNMIVMGDATITDGNIYELNLSATDLHWVVAASTDTAKRTGHSAVFDTIKNRMIVFGGNTGTFHNIGVTNTVYTFDTITSTWATLATGGVDVPSARSAQSAVFDPVFDRLIVFGGWDSNENVLNNTYVLDLSVTPAVWSKANLSVEPYPRRQASAIYDSHKKRMVIYGGLKGSGETTDEIWTLDLSQASLNGLPWTRLLPTNTADSTLARTGHGAIYDPELDAMIVNGGWSPVSLSEAYYDSTFSFTFAGTAGSWARVTPGPDVPPARRNFGAIYDPNRKSMIIFGGAYGSAAYLITYNTIYMLLHETQWPPSSGKSSVFNVPNPFNNSREKTAIKFYADNAQEVKVSIYSLIGELVKDWTVTATQGINSLEWDGSNGDGKKVESGGYICVIENNGGKNKFKIAIIK